MFETSWQVGAVMSDHEGIGNSFGHSMLRYYKCPLGHMPFSTFLPYSPETHPPIRVGVYGKDSVSKDQR